MLESFSHMIRVLNLIDWLSDMDMADFWNKKRMEWISRNVSEDIARYIRPWIFYIDYQIPKALVPAMTAVIGKYNWRLHSQAEKVLNTYATDY